MRRRLAAALVSIILLMLVVQDLPLTRYLDQVEHNQLFTALERDAWRLADQVDTALGSNDAKTAAMRVANYAKQTSARVVLTSAKGIVLVDSTNEDLGRDYTNRPEIAAGILGNASSGQRESTSIGDQLIYVAVPIEFDDSIVGVLRITVPGTTVDSIVSGRIRGVLLVGLLTLAITLMATILVANTITRRLRALQVATAEISSGNLAFRLGEKSGGAPEIRALEHTFDAMADRLQSLIESQKSFASDASHQLRTPLTALRLRLENAAAEVDDPNATAESIEAASFEVARLQMLIDGLLALARIEGSNPVLQPTEVDLLIAQRIDMWQPLADEKNIRLLRTGVSNTSVLASDASLDQMLDAYIENAIDFAPENSDIELRVDVVGENVSIHVIDQGPGMKATERERAFDRFWRGRADGSGTGLGLAIVRRLADSINAHVHLNAASPDGKGIDASITLPRHIIH
jgi:signal transduction histidine kinase